MPVSGRTKIIAFVVLGACLVAVAVALNIGWLLNWREGLLAVLGAILFLVIITGVVLNTIFLVREIRRNEHHEAFINAVTHELKTPVASMRLYLQTLQNRHVDEAKRQEFYAVMLQDSDRLQATIEQVLRAGELGARRRRSGHMAIDVSALVSECLTLARTRHRLPPETLTYLERFTNSGPRLVLGDEDELKAVVSNLVDNAIKYSGPQVRVAVELEQTDAATITLRVRDEGIGIPPTEQKRIFKRFYRIPGAMATRIKGTGLGLFIVRSVVARHGG
jgi:signal transduction histidine kinase